MERYVFIPGVLEVRSNCSPLYSFVYGIAPAWGGSDSFPESRVVVEWRVTQDATGEGADPNEVVQYLGRKIPGGPKAYMELQWDFRHPRLLTNQAYLLWSSVRGTSGHELPGKILSDVATSALIGNGFAPMHCSAVEKNGSGIILIAPSNTGKTTTSWNLVSQHGFSFIAEDIAATDGRLVYGAPFTGTGLPAPFPVQRIPLLDRMRRAVFPIWLKQSLAGEMKREQISTQARVDYVVFLERGPRGVSDMDPGTAGDLLLRNNRLEFRYLGSPHLVRSWYNGKGPDLDVTAAAEKRLLGSMVENCKRVVKISAAEPREFAEGILGLLATDGISPR
jgi:hypothetical protein